MRKPAIPYKLLLCIIGLVLTFAGIRAATIGEERMAHLSMADGLTGESVYNVMTGHDGIVWIATSNGVNVFNGKQMINIPVLDEQDHTVAVRSLCETKSHVVYAATDNGLYRIYNKYESAILTFSYREKERETWKGIHDNINNTFYFSKSY